MSTNPTWYDVLGLDRDASPEQVKRAWRDATDKFEPGSGSGQFRMFNEAADVLLDPERRRAYDAELDQGATGSTGAATTTTTTATRPTRTRAAAPVAGGAAAATAVDETAAGTDEDAGPAGKQRAARSPRDRGRLGAPSALQAGLLVVLLLVAGVTGWLALRTHQEVSDQQAVSDARDEAPAAAEQAAKAMLSYNYKTLPADRDRASAYLTGSFKKKYLANFALLEKQKDGSPGAAVQTKTVVTATVVGSGIVDAEPGTARVLVFVNQLSDKPGQDPQIFQNRVAMTMKQDGNRWLVDGLTSY